MMALYLVAFAMMGMFAVCTSALCETYCASGDAYVNGNCQNEIDKRLVCNGGFTATASGDCTQPVTCSGDNAIIGRTGNSITASNYLKCLSGPRTPAPFCDPYYCCTTSTYGLDPSMVSYCYTNSATNPCPHGGTIIPPDFSTCVISGAAYFGCPSDYKEINSTHCRKTYAPTTVMNANQCTGYPPSTYGCQWCPVVTICVPTSTPCPATCPKANTSALCTLAPSSCHWCGGVQSVQYCVNRTDEPRLLCSADCGGLIWRKDVCEGALDCHWCDEHGGRCKPRKSHGYIAWRDEVECDTGSKTYSPTVIILTASDEVTITTSGDDASGTATQTITSSMTRTSSVESSRTVSLSPTTNESFTHHPRNQTASPTGETSATVSGSLTNTRGTASLTSVSWSSSFYLPPCNASHLSLLEYVWPRFFNFTTNFSAVRQVGFPSVLLKGDLADPALIYRVPLLLRQEVLENAHPVYAAPVPYEPPNDRGFVGRRNVPVSLRWVSRTTLEVAMAPIADYWIDTDEHITIDVPFGQIVLCNRTDLYYTPTTLQLVSVHVIGPVVDESLTIALQTALFSTVATSLLSADSTASASLQTLAVLGMSRCASPAAKQGMSSDRLLSPLPLHVSSLYVDIVVGNVVLVGCVAVVQLVMLRVVMRIRRVTARSASCVVRVPSITLSAVFSLLQGTMYAGSNLVSTSSQWGDIVLGVVVLLVCCGVVVWAVWLCKQRLIRSCVAYDYARSPHYDTLYRSLWAVLMLPTSRIEPPAIRNPYSALVASYHIDCMLLPILPVMIPVGMGLLNLYAPGGLAGCAVYLSLALVLHILVAAFVVYLRPFRFVWGTVLFVLGLVINATTIVTMITSLYVPLVLNDGYFGLSMAQFVVQIIQSSNRRRP